MRNIKSGLARGEEGIGDTEGLNLQYEDFAQSLPHSRHSSISSLSDCLSDMSFNPVIPPASSSSARSPLPAQYDTFTNVSSPLPLLASPLPSPLPAETTLSLSPSQSMLATTLKPAPNRTIEDNRRRKNTRQRQHKKKRARASAAKELTGPPPEYRAHPAGAAIISAAPVIKTELDAQKLPASHGAFTGRRQPVVRKKAFDLSEILQKGFDLHEWDGWYALV